ncbi:MAG: 5'-deoxyadenosine deaminase [candidate division KSB1 bacterium]|nr:5'-deoxyadenosine deaminase [candidate division KSB1 bacterium]MDQ7064519.1 5'-deoxyadenosine deaminase [candidate division KSB1 bacterium]
MLKREDILLRGGLVVTMNQQGEVFRGDILIKNGRIAEIGKVSAGKARVIDCHHYLLLPGFVQTHVHLCQTLFRGQADDLTLLDWLQKRIWPMEGALDPAAMRISARLGIAELIKSGTTTILDMGSVRYYDVIFEEVEHAGLRVIGGKCMMDHPETTPKSLLESTRESLEETERLAKRWHGREDGRILYAVSPRFAVSCTRELMEQAAHLARENGYHLHTHASENRDEIALIEKREKVSNIHFLHYSGFTGEDVTLAHCIWLGGMEKQVIVETNTAVAHCPSSNLKLASGIAPLLDYLARGVRVGLGADGAACNNNLDIFQEMRLAALIHKPRYGADAIKAEKVVRMATIDGARALNLDHEIGSIEVGKRADIIGIQDLAVHSQPRHNVYGQLVYATSGRDVMLTIVDGRILMDNRELIPIDEEATVQTARDELKKVILKLTQK